jgi:hypothetical protein
VVGVIIRTYLVGSTLPPNTYGTLPGSVHDKTKALFQVSEAHRILESLDIRWLVHARPREVFPAEIIFMMTEHQYTLWRIAGGDYWCAQDRLDISTPNFYEIGLALNSAEGANLRPWKLDFVDGMASWSRGDQHQIALYRNGTIRGLRFGSYINLMVPDDSCNIIAQLGRFPFAKAIGL